MTSSDNTIAIYNPRKDRIETIRMRRLKAGMTPKVNLQIVSRPDGLQATDKVRAPVLRMLMDKVHEFDPRIDCARKIRPECTLYDRLARASKKVPNREAKYLLTMPEAALLRGEPPDCWLCVFKEHERRRRDNKLLRRLGKRLRYKRPQKRMN